MNEVIKRQWVEALRSGKYNQSNSGMLLRDGTGFSVLGVLCDVVKENIGETWRQYPPNGISNYVRYTFCGNFGDLPSSVTTYCSINNVSIIFAHRMVEISVLGFDKYLDFNILSDLIEERFHD